MSWEIWRFSPGDGAERGEILEVLSFGADDGAARAKFTELQTEAELHGGAFEMRRDGIYVCFFSCTMPIKKEGQD